VSIRLLKNESAAHTALQNGQLEHAIVLTRHSLEVYEERGHLIWAKPLNYLSVLAEYAFLQLRLGQWEQAQFSLSKLETFQREIQCQDHPELCRFLELVHTRLTLEYSVRRGDLECNSEKSSRLLTLASAEFHSEHRAVIQVLVAGIFINMEELSKARRVLNKVMERGVKNRKNTNWRGCALVMQLIIDLETEPAHFVIQYIKSVRRQLMQSDQLNPIVKLFLSYAQKITKAAHLLQKQELWKELSDELLKSSQSNEQFDLVYFDLKSWALSKALNEKYSVVLSQKNQHGQVNSLRISA
jgi:hypothetical protein